MVCFLGIGLADPHTHLFLSSSETPRWVVRPQQSIDSFLTSANAVNSRTMPSQHTMLPPEEPRAAWQEPWLERHRALSITQKNRF